MSFVTIILQTLSSWFLAVKTKEELIKSIKKPSLITLGIACLAIVLYFKYQYQKEIHLTQTKTYHVFEEKLDSIVLLHQQQSQLHPLEELQEDYDVWITQLPQSLQKKKHEEEKQLLNDKLLEIEKQKPLVQDYLQFCSSLQKYVETYNHTHGDSLLFFEATDFSDLEKEQFGIIRGKSNTQYITFDLLDKECSFGSPSINIYSLPNNIYDSHMNTIATSDDSLEVYFSLASFKLNLHEYKKLDISFVTDKVSVIEYQDILHHKTFKNEYDRKSSTTNYLKKITKKYIEEVIYLEEYNKGILVYN